MTERDLAKAFQEGKHVRRSGVPRDENPYPEGSEKREEWFEGWDDAKHDDIDEAMRNRP